MRDYVGNHRRKLFGWYSDHWLTKGPPVCFLEGPPGVGKTNLATDIEDSWAQRFRKPHFLLEASESSESALYKMLFELAGALNDEKLPNLSDAVSKGSDLIAAFAKIMEQPLLVIIDEAQCLFHGSSNRPGQELTQLLHRLQNRNTLPGRLLLVCDRVVERARWSEPFEIRRLEKLEIDEAEQLLLELLQGLDREDEVPLDQRRDIVTILDRNPRALQAFVTTLEYDSLANIMGRDPGLWSTADRDVSPELVITLERELLERTLSKIDARLRDLLQRLAVHRRAVEKTALRRLCSSDSELAIFRDSLIQRFLLHQRAGWFTLNPIAREIALVRLKESASRLTQAHSAAADYYAAPFKARQITLDIRRLSGRFAELRYHMVNAARTDELREPILQFTEYLRAEFAADQSIPPRGSELDERIAVLSVLLEQPGAKSLEYYLARLLEARRGLRDLTNAAIHAERAVGPSAALHNWIFHIRLQRQVHGVDKGLSAMNEAFKKLPEGDKQSQLYLIGAEMLGSVQRHADAISLLRQGILYVPKEKDRSMLYHRCAELLTQAGETDEAIQLLRQGISEIPADKGLYTLYEMSAHLLQRRGDLDEAVKMMREAIGLIPKGDVVPSTAQRYATVLADTGESARAIQLLRDTISIAGDSSGPLFQACAELLVREGRANEAIELLREGIDIVPADKSFPLYLSYAELLSREDRRSEAIELLRDALGKIAPDKGLSNVYQFCSDLLDREGRRNEAIELLIEGIHNIPPDKGAEPLYRYCAKLLHKEGRDAEAIQVLKDGTNKFPPGNNLASVYLSLGRLLCMLHQPENALEVLREGVVKVGPTQFPGVGLSAITMLMALGVGRDEIIPEIITSTEATAVDAAQKAFGRVLLLEIEGHWNPAGELARSSGLKLPNYPLLVIHQAFCFLCAGDNPAAEKAFTDYQGLMDLAGSPHFWLRSFVQLRLGHFGEARTHLRSYLSGESSIPGNLDEDFLLRLWDGQVSAAKVRLLPLYFPMLPPSLTGHKVMVRRVEYGPSVLIARKDQIVGGGARQEFDPAVPRDPFSSGMDSSARKEMKPRVFVSHSSKDKQFVRRLVSDLSKRNNIVWFDERELKPGDSIAAGISDGLKSTDYLVVILSKASIHSKWVQAELNAALMEQLSTGGVTVLPALIEDCEVPILLRDRIHADFRTSYDHGLEQLIEVLAMEIPPSTPSPIQDGDDCESQLRRLSLADLRRRLVQRLSRTEISTVWWDIFEQSLDDGHPSAGLNECVIHLLDRAKKELKLDQVHRALCFERPDLTDV